MFCIVFLFALFSSLSTRSINKPHLEISHRINNQKLQNSDDSDVWSTESTDDAAGFFFKPRFGKRDAEEATHASEDSALSGFFFQPKHGKRSVLDESVTDDSTGFVMNLKPRQGKRSADDREGVMATEDSAAVYPGHGPKTTKSDVENITQSFGSGLRSASGFFMKPKQGRRAVNEEPTEISDSGTGGFFYRPKHGKRAANPL